MAAWDATTTSESLPSHYTYEGTHGCQEHVQLMRQEWSDEGWFVDSILILKTSVSYKVEVTYGKQVEGTKDHFKETLWRAPNLNWKPTGVSTKPREENQLIIHWWRRSDSARIMENLKRMRLKPLPNDAAGAASASGTNDRMELAMDPMDVPVPTTTPTPKLFWRIHILAHAQAPQDDE